MTKKEPERIQIRETEPYYGSLCGPFASIISQIQEKLDLGWEGIVIEQGYYAHDYPYLYRHRLENDKEYEARMRLLEKQELQKKKAKEKRREQYEKLKKEFDDE